MHDSCDYQDIIYTDAGLPINFKVAKMLCGDETEEQLSEPRWHEALEIKYFISGNAELTCGPRVFIASQGDIVITNPCERHSIRPVNGGETFYHLLLIDPQMYIGGSAGRLLEPVVGGRMRFNNHIRADSASAVRLTPIMLAVIDEFAAQREGYELYSVGLMAQFFAELMRSEVQRDIPTAEPDDIRRYAERLEEAFALIGADYRSELTLDDLAAACDMSRWYFCHIFKAVTGCAPMAYLNEYRISKAEIMLRSSDIGIGDIAAAVGFADVCYFSRTFKRLRGISPNRFRAAEKAK